MTEYLLSYHDIPPSFNAVGHTGNRWTWTSAKKRWQKTMEDMLMVGGVPRDLDQVYAFARLTFSRGGRRDVVNYRTILEKCLGDALVTGRWLPDDTPGLFTFGTVEFDVGQKKMELIILTGPEAAAVTPPRLKGRDQVSHPTPPQAPDQGSTAPPRRFRRPPRG